MVYGVCFSQRRINKQASVIPAPVCLMPMKISRPKTFFLLVGLVLVCTVLVALNRFEPRESDLLISNRHGKVLGCLRLKDGRFDHVFVHSIHLTKVEEKFEVDDSGNLHLFELRYESSGVGMPSDAEGGYRLEDGRFILSMNRTFHKIQLFVSIVPGHGVSVGGKFHPFTEWAKPEDVLILTVRMHL
jgi:hypothetical protein